MAERERERERKGTEKKEQKTKGQKHLVHLGRC